MMLLCVCSDTFPKASTFRKAFTTFRDALQVEWMFKCPMCLDAPKVLCCDATMLTMMKERYHGTSITSVPHGSDVIRGPGHRRVDRSFANVTTTHQALEHFAAYVRGKSDDTWINPRTRNPMKGMPDNYNYVASINESSLSSLIVYIPFGEQGTLQPYSLKDTFLLLGSYVPTNRTAICDVHIFGDARAKVARLVSCLASSSPVSSYVPTAAVEALTQALERRASFPDLSELTIISQQAPILYEALMAMHSCIPTFSMASKEWYGLMARLCDMGKKCVSVFPSSNSNQGQRIDGLPQPDDAMEAQPSCLGAECLQTGIMSGLARVRPRLKCEADGNAKEATCRDAPTCNHGFFAVGKRTGGIFAWFCEHGVCYAAYIIPNAEGRDEAYSFLTGYLRKAPEVVIYDYACNLHEYCLNRSPEYFKHTMFVIDNFHWGNHTSCCFGYSMKPYPCLAHINSQLAEQCNSALKKIKPALSFMIQRNFMASLRLYLHGWNMGKREQVHDLLTHMDALRNAPQDM